MYLSWYLYLSEKRTQPEGSRRSDSEQVVSTNFVMQSNTLPRGDYGASPMQSPCLPSPLLSVSLLWDEGIGTDPVDLLRSRLTLNSWTDSLILVSAGWIGTFVSFFPFSLSHYEPKTF